MNPVRPTSNTLTALDDEARRQRTRPTRQPQGATHREQVNTVPFPQAQTRAPAPNAPLAGLAGFQAFTRKRAESAPNVGAAARQNYGIRADIPARPEYAQTLGVPAGGGLFGAIRRRLNSLPNNRPPPQNQPSTLPQPRSLSVPFGHQRLDSMTTLVGPPEPAPGRRRPRKLKKPLPNPTPANDPRNFVRAAFGGGYRLHPEAVLADLSVLLTDPQSIGRKGLPEPVLAASLRDGAYHLAWRHWNYFDPSFSSARDVLKTLVSNIPVASKEIRPFLELHSPVGGSRKFEVVAGVNAALERSFREIDDVTYITATALRPLIRRISERMHRVAASALGPAPIIGDAPKTITGCWMDWMDALDRAWLSLPRSSIHRRKHILDAIRIARAYWMDHAQTYESAGRYMLSISNQWRDFLPQLSATAQTLHFELVRGSQMERLPALEWDNASKRVWETALAAALVTNPPKPVLTAAGYLSRQLEAHLNWVRGNYPAAFENIIEKSQRSMSYRPWMKKVDKLYQFVYSSPANRADRLFKYLHAWPVTGPEGLSVYYATAKIVEQMNKFVPNCVFGETVRDTADRRTLETARARITDMDRPPTFGANMLLRHQPPLQNDPYRKEFSYKPAIRDRPNWNAEHSAVSRGLAAGAPYISGQSGSTVFLARILKHMINVEHAPIEMHDAMLGLYMFMAHDGGHSLHELMWVLNLIKPHSDFGMSGTYNENPNEYLSNYLDFFLALAPETRRLTDRAVEEAHREVLAYRRANRPQGPLPA